MLTPRSYCTPLICLRKFENGFAAYEANTGKAHPLSIIPDDLDNSGDDNSGNDGSSDDGSGLRRRATAAASKNAVPLTDDNNGELWQGTLSIGTPARQYTVQFDTGSSDLFVPGPSCSGCNGHTRYNPANSSTSINLNRTFQLSYGSGQVQGNLFSDLVSINGFNVSGAPGGPRCNRG